MKYVLLGNLNADWASRQGERTDRARAKLDELGITLESVLYTQGPYDFVDVVDAPNSEVMLAFSVWYAKEGHGRFATLPAFTEAELQAAASKA